MLNIKRTIIKMFVASSLVLATGMVKADIRVSDATAPLAAITLDMINIKQDLQQTLLQLQQQQKQDSYHNARQAIIETAVTANGMPRLQD